MAGASSASGAAGGLGARGVAVASGAGGGGATGGGGCGASAAPGFSAVSVSFTKVFFNVRSRNGVRTDLRKPDGSHAARMVAEQIRAVRSHLRVAEMPLPLVGTAIELLWPAATDDDPACAFLRERVVTLTGGARFDVRPGAIRRITD